MWPSAPGSPAPQPQGFHAPAAAPYGEPQMPSPTPREVSVVDAFRFVFREPDLVSNVLFGALLQFIPLVGPIVRMGWATETSRRLVYGHPRPIPKFSFSDFTKYLERGVVPFVTQFVIALGLMLPALILGILVGVLVPTLGSNSDQIAILIGLSAAILGLPLFVAYLLFMHSALVLAELSGDFRTSFTLALHKAYLSRCWGKILVSSLVLSLFMFGFALVGVLACFVGIYATIQVVLFAAGHLRYQLYNSYRLQGGAAVAMQPPTPTEEERRAAWAAQQYYPGGFHSAQGYPHPGYPPPNPPGPGQSGPNYPGA